MEEREGNNRNRETGINAEKMEARKSKRRRGGTPRGGGGGDANASDQQPQDGHTCARAWGRRTDMLMYRIQAR